MAYSVLREDHYRVIGKTTGTDARMMYWFTQKEYDVIRKPQGANIGEQRDIIRKVVKQKQTHLLMSVWLLTLTTKLHSKRFSKGKHWRYCKRDGRSHGCIGSNS